MTQSQENDYEDEEDGEDCDCEVCRASKDEDDDAIEQIAIDRVSDNEWQICDFESGIQPATYLVLATPISGHKFANMNFVLVECDSDNFDNAFEDYQVFIREVWSTDVYIANPKSYEMFTDALIGCIPDAKIANPVELTYLFGGTVNHRQVNMPIVPDTH